MYKATQTRLTCQSLPLSFSVPINDLQASSRIQQHADKCRFLSRQEIFRTAPRTTRARRLLGGTRSTPSRT